MQPFFVKAGLPVNDDVLMRVTPLIKERLTTLDDAVNMAGFFFRPRGDPAARGADAKPIRRRQVPLRGRRWWAAS